MIRFFLILLLLVPSVAGAKHLGNSTGCSGVDYTNSVDWVVLSGKFTAPEDGTLDSVCLELLTGGEAEVSKMAVYSYANSTFTLVDYTAEFTPGNGWNQVTQKALTQSGSLVAGTVYWAALWAQGGHSSTCGLMWDDSDADSTYGYWKTYATNFPTGFGFSNCSKYYRASCGYIVYTPSGAPPATTSQITIKGTTVIKGVVKCGD